MNLNETEKHYKEIVEQAGAEYVGVQEGYKDIPSSVLFNNDKNDTFAVFVPNFSLEAVIKRLKEGSN